MTDTATTRAGVHPWSPELTDELRRSGLDPALVADVVVRALEEDLAWGPDVTTEATVPASATGTADVVARAPGCVAGLAVAHAVLEAWAEQTGSSLEVVRVRHDGDRVAAGDVLLTVTGPLRCLLTAERTTLNLLGQLSGVATATAAWVDALAGTGSVVRDSRKTVPGLRALQKYAVRCGGGANHRMGLGDAALVKDNHVAAAGSVAAAFRAVRALAPDVEVEVECDTLAQVREAIDAGATLVLLDNMGPDALREAVGLAAAAGVRTEASGGLTIEDAAAVAATGVDYLAVGALTHSAPVLDVALDLRAA